MSSDTTDEGQNTRPISVAELLARNGTIGAPPVGGRRRRRRGNSSAVTVAELTGEMPAIRDEPAPAEPEAISEPEPEPEAEPEAVEPGPEPEAEPEAVEPEPEPEPVEDEPASEPEPVEGEPVVKPDAEAEAEPQRHPVEPAPPRAGDPRPRRGSGPELSHDPRPVRRSSGAEQMAYDPVDESVDLAGLVADQAADEAQLRSYLKASGGTLFSGETVADDRARRGLSEDEPDDGTVSPAPSAAGRTAPSGGRLAAIRHGAVALAQSVLAVLFGAGLFIAFDQLWRWNTIVALVLSVLVILGLVVAVRVVRKTEDIASTLIAVAVGALVTLGPLALLQSYG